MHKTILAIETSCDETAIAILKGSGDFKNAEFTVLANTVLSQIDIHKEYGGVFPALAKREHSKNLVPVFMKALGDNFKKETRSFTDKEIEHLEKILEREPALLEYFLKSVPAVNPGIDAIAVTHGPGLEPALWVGINFARALAYIWNIPIVPVNHMEGHIFSSFVEETSFSVNEETVLFPALALLVSGGHTELVLIKNWFQYEKIGETRDDASGEAFDKVARILGLPYPGGPEISRIAKECDEVPEEYALPRPMLHTDDFDFSFSGLKTAVLYMVRDLHELSENARACIAHEFQNAVVDVLTEKTKRAVEQHEVRTIVLGGGVAANEALRESLSNTFHNSQKLFLPDKKATGDNALMIATAGYFRFLNEDTVTPEKIVARGNLSL